jgi:hypothetical protein
MSNDVELHDGVKLLIARMKSHPEEFAGVFEGGGDPYTITTSKWTSVVHRFWKVLTEPEQEAIRAGLTTANRHCFHATVMETILVGNREEPTERLRFGSGGMLGVGTVTPEQQLHLPGMLTATEYAISNAPVMIKNNAP